MISCVRAILKKEGEILLVKHADRDYYCLPGGTIEEKETLKQTLLRELEEELCITKLQDLTFDSVYEFQKDDGGVFREFWFRAETEEDFDLEKASHGFEITEARWFTLEEIKKTEVKPDNLFERILSGDVYVNTIDFDKK